MPDMQEVFRMATQKVRPNPGFVDRQYENQRRLSRRRKASALALVAVLVVVGVVVGISTLRSGDEGKVTPGSGSAPTPTATLPEFSVPSLVDLQTGGVTPLPQSILGGSLYFTSPDRTMFVINSCCSTPNPISVANVDGTGVRQITPDGIDGFTARWSPDGSMLVYQQRDGGTDEIGNLFVVDVATGDATQITDLDPENYGLWALHPSFSPDGETIIFHLPRGPKGYVSTRWDLWSVPVTGGEPTLVVHNASMGVYGPDGGTLAYLDSPNGDWTSSRLMLADVDGSDPRLIVRGNRIEFPRWSPDGTRIAYSDADGIHVVDVSTGAASLVAEGASCDWFGDDTLVVVP
jgi:dipeptidyl aminopeptidase/acylaminoacyl peptidase